MVRCLKCRFIACKECSEKYEEVDQMLRERADTHLEYYDDAFDKLRELTKK